jgi:hypothetical protein
VITGQHVGKDGPVASGSSLNFNISEATDLDCFFTNLGCLPLTIDLVPSRIGGIEPLDIDILNIREGVGDPQAQYSL